MGSESSVEQGERGFDTRAALEFDEARQGARLHCGFRQMR
jgi:hypothetical protein